MCPAHERATHLLRILRVAALLVASLLRGSLVVVVVGGHVVLEFESLGCVWRSLESLNSVFANEIDGGILIELLRETVRLDLAGVLGLTGAACEDQMEIRSGRHASKG